MRRSTHLTNALAGLSGSLGALSTDAFRRRGTPGVDFVIAPEPSSHTQSPASGVPSASPSQIAQWSCRPIKIVVKKYPMTIGTMVNGKVVVVKVPVGSALPSGAWYVSQDGGHWHIILGENYFANEDGEWTSFAGGKPVPYYTALALFDVSCQGGMLGAPPARRVSSNAAGNGPRRIVVKRGDRFLDIARRFQIPTGQLVHMNPHVKRRDWRGITILDLTEGDVLVVPVVPVPNGYYWDSQYANFRKNPACPVGKIWDKSKKTCVWPQRSWMLGHPGVLGGDDECSTAFGTITSPYDGNAGTSGGNPGVCNSGTCIQIAKTGLNDNSDGKPCNVNGVVGVWQQGQCVAGVQSGTCTDVFGNTGKYDSSNFCVTLTGNQGDKCVGGGGIQGTFDANGNCIACGQFQMQDASGACVDAPCPACMDRATPGDDCVPITSAAQCGPDAPIYDPNGDGAGHCCFGACGPNQTYNYTTHTCDCNAGTVWNSSTGACVTPTSPPPTCGATEHFDAATGTCVANAPPKPKDPCPISNGVQTVSYAGGPCIAPPKTCPTGQTLDSNGNCVAAAAATPKSNWGLYAAIAAGVAVVGGGAYVATKKKSRSKK